MALRGDLASVDLAQVFQMLALNQKVGMLYIQSPNSWKALYFNDKGVTLYFNEHTMLDRVLSKLVGGGHISESGVIEAREHAAHQGHQVVDGLLAGGYLTEDDLDRRVRMEIEEEIYELFFWSDAKFEFYEGATDCAGREGVIHDQFFFGTDAIIMEAARRIDEWGYIKSLVPTGREVFRTIAGDAEAFNLQEEDFQVFELLDGTRNVDRVIEITGQPAFHIQKTICLLLEDNVAEALPPQRLETTGRDLMAEGRTKDAINLFELAVELGEGLPDIHTQAARAYQSIGEYELSAQHTKALAEFHFSSGNARKAAALFREVLETIPTDLEACQRVVELSIDHPDLATDDFDPLNVGKDLVNLFLEMGEINRVRSLLEDLIRQHPTDIELKKSLINCHTKVGDTKRVVELYESIAEDLTKGGDPIEAIKYLQKILQLDRSRMDISEWIKRLYQVDERQRSRRRSMVALGMVFCLLVLASFGYYFYNEAAKKEFGTLDLAGLVEKKDFGGARAVIDQFVQAYPFTIVVNEAKTELERISQIEAAEQELLDEVRRKGQVRLEGIRARYRGAWDKKTEQFDRNELEKALQSIEQVRKLVAEAGQAQDEAWARDKNVDKSYTELLTYLADATRLDREAREARDRGDWNECRRLTLDLVTHYELADVARRGRIPVQLITRPAGALVYDGDKPLVGEGDSEPLKTPCVVYCENRESVEFTLRRPGFHPQALRLSPVKTASIEKILAIVPIRTLKFEAEATNSPGISATGRLAVGLRGGRFGLSANGDDGPQVVKLPGLGEVVGTPGVGDSGIFIVTNDSELAGHAPDTGERIWRTSLKSPAEFDPVLHNNRLFVVDRSGRLLCMSASQKGRILWQRSMNGVATGRPTVSGRNVAVGSLLGTVLLLDTLKGAVVSELQMKTGVTTEVHVTDNFLVFGTEDGNLHCFRRGAEKATWVRDLGRAIREGETRLFGVEGKADSIVVVGADNLLERIRLNDGEVLASRSMTDRIRPGFVTLDEQLFVVVRVSKQNEDASIRNWDVLLALDPDTFETNWTFSDGGDFRGRPVHGASRLYVTGSNGEVHRLQ